VPKYYSPSWLGQLALGGGVRVKSHTDPEVSIGYMEALDKLVPGKEECANPRLELGRYFSCTGLFGSLHAMDDRDRFDALKWWEAYGGIGTFSKIGKRRSLTGCKYFFCREVLEHFIHNVRRNRLNENRAESLVYVHYNLRLLSHYCDRAYEDSTYKIWDNQPRTIIWRMALYILKNWKQNL